jgi:hypoxanthine-DNA glycosylase
MAPITGSVPFSFASSYNKEVQKAKSVFLSHPFPPLYDGASRILILGSFPSVKSREQAFYYGHPQNRFWRLLSQVYQEDVPGTVEEKTALVLRHHLALYDVIDGCEILGSSDASIRQVKPSDLSRIHSPLKTILLNGETAGKLFERYQASLTGLPFFILPSTSPANASKSLADLVEAWRPFLLDN